MKAGLWTTAKKIQSAINRYTENVKLLVTTKQWYSTDKGRPVTCYIISESQQIEGDEGKTNRRKTREVFSTYSQVQLILWLRDYWYNLNGWEIPANDTWEAVKKEYGTEKET